MSAHRECIAIVRGWAMDDPSASVSAARLAFEEGRAPIAPEIQLRDYRKDLARVAAERDEAVRLLRKGRGGGWSDEDIDAVDALLARIDAKEPG